jgi:hypothetical protein
MKNPAPKRISKSPAKFTRKPAARKAAPRKAKQRLQPSKDGTVLLSGGNPQIAKGYGEAPVQAYIAAMPGWKSHLGRRLDAIVTREVPGVVKAVKWNSPLYGMPPAEGEKQTWFIGVHVFAKYVKIAFFRGVSLRPVPPGESKHEHVRYLNVHEGEFDEAQFAKWVKQASKLPGEKM